ncbi:MAG: hypothetical protein AAFP76_15925 [Bacteroidota bacterium]
MTKFHVNQMVMDGGKVVKFSLHDHSQNRLSWREVLNLWTQDETFVQCYNDLLSHAPFESFYWEHPPITTEELVRPYEFVLVRGGGILDGIQPNWSRFAGHFEGSEKVVSFYNLGKDAKLVVPIPESNQTDFAHLAKFVRSAPKDQLHAFWKMVGEQTLEEVHLGKKWLSTAGLGVNWLHIRIDSRPKYYKYTPYRMM